MDDLRSVTDDRGWEPRRRLRELPLSDDVVGELLSQVDDLLGRVEEIPGKSGAVARDALARLAEMYGEALARMLALLPSEPDTQRRLTSDPLVDLLLILHDLQPNAAAAPGEWAWKGDS